MIALRCGFLPRIAEKNWHKHNVKCGNKRGFSRIRSFNADLLKGACGDENGTQDRSADKLGFVNIKGLFFGEKPSAVFRKSVGKGNQCKEKYCRHNASYRSDGKGRDSGRLFLRNECKTPYRRGDKKHKV